MKIRGKEIKFLRTAKTTADLADLCPNGDIAKLPTVFKTGKYSEIVENSAKFIHIMHKGYEMNLKLNDKDYRSAYNYAHSCDKKGRDYIFSALSFFRHK